MKCRSYPHWMDLAGTEPGKRFSRFSAENPPDPENRQARIREFTVLLNFK